MIDSLHERFTFMEQGVRGVRTLDKIGTVRRVTGLVIESEGPGDLRSLLHGSDTWTIN